ncbi:MAG: hypothetical protein FJZ69_04785 [Bacteroidetes bacterium]|nr:hypothetical protein [Bacteroidota bacterium]
MKKFLLLVAFASTVSFVQAQDNQKGAQTFGVSFYLNDFATASRIRTTSLNTVIAEKTFSRVVEMSAGLAVNYAKQIRPNTSFAASLGISGMRYPMTGRVINNSRSLLEFSAALNFMMTTDEYYVQPYLTLGVGGHRYGPHYGAFIPAGLGLKLNIFSEANLFITSNYRVPVTNETASYHFQHMIGVAAPLGKKK